MNSNFFECAQSYVKITHMKTVFHTLLALLTVTCSGLFAQQKFPLEKFEKLNITCTQDVYLVPDGESYMEITEGTLSADKLPFDVKGNTLSLKASKLLSKKAVLKVHTGNITSLAVSGSSDVISEKVLSGDKLEISSSGSSDLNLKLSYKEVDLSVSGAGDIQLEGKTGTLRADLSGASDLHAAKLETDNTTISISGAGDAHLWVNQSLSGSVSGVGSIKYKGDAKDINIEKSGMGSVSKVASLASEKGMEAEKNGDTTRLRIGGKNLLIIDEVIGANQEAENRKKEREEEDNDRMRDLWSGLELGINGYATASRSLGLPRENGFLDLNYGRSFNININPFIKHIPLIGPYVGLSTGLGLEFNRYYFADRIRLETAPDTLTGVYTGLRYRTNVLRMTYLTLPLMLQFQAGNTPEKAAALAVGVIGGWRPWNARLRQIYTIDEKTYKTTTKENYYVNPFKLSLAARVAFKHLELYASYSLTPLFAKDKTIELYPFSLGLRLFSF